MRETEQMDKVGDLEWDKDGIVGWTVASWFGPVHPAYNLYFSACFFSAGTIFFSHNKSVNSVFSRLISTAERGLFISLSQPFYLSKPTIQLSIFFLFEDNICILVYIYKMPRKTPRLT
jgi:hypothetical protein